MPKNLNRFYDSQLHTTNDIISQGYWFEIGRKKANRELSPFETTLPLLFSFIFGAAFIVSYFVDSTSTPLTLDIGLILISLPTLIFTLSILSEINYHKKGDYRVDKWKDKYLYHGEVTDEKLEQAKKLSKKIANKYGTVFSPTAIMKIMDCDGQYIKLTPGYIHKNFCELSLDDMYDEYCNTNLIKSIDDTVYHVHEFNIESINNYSKNSDDFRKNDYSFYLGSAYSITLENRVCDFINRLSEITNTVQLNFTTKEEYEMDTQDLIEGDTGHPIYTLLFRKFNFNNRSNDDSDTEFRNDVVRLKKNVGR